MIAIIENKRKLNIEKLKKSLSELGIKEIYESTEHEDQKVNEFLEKNSKETTCLYLDAQIELVNVNEKLLESSDVVGGLILSHTDEPMWGNYGYEPHPIKGVFADTLQKTALNFWENSDVRDYVKKTIKPYSFNFEEPKETEAENVSELFFAFSVEKILEVGGIDTKFKDFGMGPDLCKRVRVSGGSVLFNPDLKVKYLESREEGVEKKESNQLEDSIYWYEKHHNIDRDTYMKLFYIPEIHEY